MKYNNEQSNKAYQDICYKGVLQVLISLGLEGELGGESKKLRQNLNVIEKYDRLLIELIRVLTDKKYLTLLDNRFVIPNHIKAQLQGFNVSSELDKADEANKDHQASSTLVEVCLNSFEQILLGNVQSTDVIFPEGKMDLVSGVYKGNKLADYFNDILCKLVRSIIGSSIEHLKEGERFTILEVGAGTGGTSELLFDAIKDFKDKIRYIYTDLSKSFLFYAEDKYKEQAPYLETELFNIESAPDQQNIPFGSCDMVIGANVVHATKDIANSLQNIKAVLKKNGVIILNEIAQTEIFSTLTFGLLDGWWLYEDKELRLQGSPGLSEESWKHVLSNTGYLNTTCYPKEENKPQQIIISQSNGEFIVNSTQKKSEPQSKPVVKPTSTPSWEKQLKQQRLDPIKVETFIRTKLGNVLKMEPSQFDGETSLSDYGVDSILGLALVKEINKELKETIPTTILFDYPSINELTKYLFEKYAFRFLPQEKTVHDSSSNIQHEVQIKNQQSINSKVESSKNAQDQDLPDAKKAESFLRNKLGEVLKMEPSQFDGETSLSDYGVDSILGLALVKNINKELGETIPTTILFDYPTVNDLSGYLVAKYGKHFMLVNVHLKVNSLERINTPTEESNIPIVEKSKTTFIAKSSPDSITVASQQGWRLWLKAPDTIENMQLQPFTPAQPKTGEVLVATTNFSLNFGDLLCVKGLYPTMPSYPFSPGFEASGIIEQVGDGVTEFEIGDEVILLSDENYGLHSSHCLVKESHLLRVPRNQSLAEASTMPIVGMTIVEVFRRLNLRKGNTILIQTATGGTGLLSVQLAQYYGLNIIATAGSDDKLAYLTNLGVDHVINYRTQDFEEEVMKITNGKGVSYVINTLLGDNIQKGINCLDKRGQYVELSMTALKSARKIDLSKFSNNQSFLALDLRKVMAEEPDYVLDLWNDCKSLIESNILKSTISAEVDFNDFKEAYSLLENRSNIGKVVVNVNHQNSNENKSVSETTSNKVSRKKINNGMDIAIVGVSGQYGKSKDLEEFWEVLKAGQSLIEEVPEEKWDAAEHFSSNRKDEGKTYSKWGSFLREMDKFDPMFFRISGLEAENMDPQQRFFLQHCWKALEDASITPKQLNGKKCGVYVGAAKGDYMLNVKAKDPSVFWGNSSSILASRISYYLNLKGAAIAVDTACSSSLVATDMACKSLIQGDTDVVLCGGVTISTTSTFYKLASKAGMLSEDGQCYTFDHRANGFVPGEGVGVLVLKRLEDAERDGDSIYGVIKGIGTNQDGKTNGIMAPSARSQENLEKDVYEKYNINPESISYVEAHGTGTSLGDPIEFDALTNSFRDSTSKKQFCGLGSVKTNIGHTLMASGVAGIHKVVLSMKHKMLPASLNYEKANPLLDIDNSPFYVNDELKDWEVEEDMPRRATVSSFGFSGTNAHVVIEEYISNAPAYQSNDNAIVLLSARNRNRLEEQVSNLLNFIKKQESISLFDVAYTLQVGREEMDERVAFITSDIKDLIQQLKDYLNGNIQSIIKGNKKQQKETFVLKGKAGEAYLREAIRNKEGESLAQLWVTGVSIDWKLLYPKTRQPKKVNLPTYPFAKESYWIASLETKFEETQRKLHPLLHTDTSDDKGDRYKSIYSGKESFLVDHIINKDKILPGVAYLELARMAGKLSSKNTVTKLNDITWLSPIRVNGKSKEVHIKVIPNGESSRYEVCLPNNNEVCSQGKISTEQLGIPKTFDLDCIRNSLNNVLLKDECYAIFHKIGIQYGTSFQGIEKLWYDDHAALSKIVLPNDPEYVLPPGMLDSALQTCVGLSINRDVSEIALPFSIKEVMLYSSLPDTAWCYVRKSDTKEVNSKLISYDLDLLTDEGQVLISIREFVTLPIKNNDPKPTTKGKPSTHFLTNSWSSHSNAPSQPVCDSQLVLVAGGAAEFAEKLREEIETEVEVVKGDSESDYFESVFEKVKDRLKTRETVNITILCQNDEYIDYGFVSGLIKTAHQENPKVTGKIIGVNRLSVKDISEITEILEVEQTQSEVEVRYLNNKRESKKISLLQTVEKEKSPVFVKEGGVYLITGGTGELGKIIARHLNQTKNTTLILTGRGSVTTEKQLFLDSLNHAVYYSCDVTSKDEVSALVQKIKSEYGGLNGIIHSAGVFKDGLITKKDTSEVHNVLSPKIDGTKNLDEFTKMESLDFMVLFSSIAGVFGNIGQADYSSANAYLDNFAEYRDFLNEKGERSGRTISINWPLWEDGGMRMDAESERHIRNQSGMMPLPTSEGTHALDLLLGSALNQAIVMFGIENNINKQSAPKDVKVKKSSIKVVEGSSQLAERVIAKITEMIAELLKLDTNNLSPDEELGDYGFDSILLTKFGNELNEFYGLDLLPTVFYNYPTIAGLSEHLIEEYSQKLMDCHNESAEVPVASVQEVLSSLPTRDKKNITQKYNVSQPIEQSTKVVHNERPSENRTEGVAIVGVHCRFPESPDVSSFWENIKGNKDLIQEVPSFRWDWKEYYGDPHKEPNKTKVKWGGFIDNIDQFDANFFNISPREAELMDPQQRITLQSVYHAFEDAGISIDQIKGSNIGVFIGVSTSDYSILLNNYEDLSDLAKVSTGSAHSVLVNRISYLLDLHGPSEPIDTACSSSLIAIHRAVENITNGHCDMAVAGGVNAILSPQVTLSFSQAGMLSQDGKCMTFDQRANGYVRGEGVGTVILKSLSKAKEDGDTIYGVIKGTAENHGGKANTLTSPNPNAQKDLLLKAYRSANVDPRDVNYIEAHGTGTPLGDPVETEGLKLAFKELYKERELEMPTTPYCSIGSVKTNIGHLEAASGIAGIIKVIMALRHKTIPGNVHLQTPNNYVNLKNSPFYLQEKTSSWDSKQNKPRIAGVSSFGFGGANAHVIIEEYSAQDKNTFRSDSPAIVVLSAKNESKLKEQAQNLFSYCTSNSTNSLHAIAYTLQVGREKMDSRLAIVVNTQEELINQLKCYLKDKTGKYLMNTKSETAFFPLKGEAERAYIHQVIDKKEYDALAQLWVSGVKIDWQLFYGGLTPSKVNLPAYPFDKKSYWIGNSSNKIVAKNEVVEDEFTDPAFARLDDMKAIISSITKLDIEQIDGKVSLFDLGLDSVMFFSLLSRLSQKFPELDLKLHGNRLLGASHLVDLTNQLNELILNAKALEQREGVKIEKPLVQKSNEINSVCESIKMNKGKLMGAEGILVVNENHPFFFDHPLDHVSGIHLAEGMSEIAKTCLYDKEKPKNTELIFMKEVLVSYRNYTTKDEPIQVNALEKVSTLPEGEVNIGLNIKQGNKLNAEGNIVLVKMNKPETQKFVWDEKILPCDQRIVNKHKAENVLISEVKKGKGSESLFCWVLPLKRDSFFSDYPEPCVDGVVLLEAVRQSFRAFSYLRNQEEGSLTNSKEEMEFLGGLKSLTMKMFRPVMRGEGIKLVEEETEKTEVGSNQLVRMKGQFISGEKVCGEFEVVALILDKEVYGKWRDDNVNSTLYVPEKAIQ